MASREDLHGQFIAALGDRLIGRYSDGGSSLAKPRLDARRARLLRRRPKRVIVSHLIEYAQDSRKTPFLLARARIFRGIVSVPVARTIVKRDTGRRNPQPGIFPSKFSGQGHGDTRYVPVRQTNSLASGEGRDRRRLTLAARDEATAAYLKDLRKRTAASS